MFYIITRILYLAVVIQSKSVAMMRVEICWLEVLVEDLLIAMPLLILPLIVSTLSTIWFLGHSAVQGTASPIISGDLLTMDAHIDLHHQVSTPQQKNGAFFATSVVIVEVLLVPSFNVVTYL